MPEELVCEALLEESGTVPPRHTSTQTHCASGYTQRPTPCTQRAEVAGGASGHGGCPCPVDSLGGSPGVAPERARGVAGGCGLPRARRTGCKSMPWACGSRSRWSSRSRAVNRARRHRRCHRHRAGGSCLRSERRSPRRPPLLRRRPSTRPTRRCAMRWRAPLCSGRGRLDRLLPPPLVHLPQRSR